MLPSIIIGAVALASLFRRYVRNLPKQRKSRDRLVILVTGSSGSGKSTLTKRLAEVLTAPIVHQDNHFSAPFVQYKDAIDDRMELPDHIDFDGIIKEIKSSANIPRKTHQTVLIEGHTLLSNDNLVSVVDLVLFLNVESIETALKRRVGRRERDAETNFYLARYYRQFVWTAHQKYIVPKLSALVARGDPRLHILRAEDSVDLLTKKSLTIISNLRK